MQNLWNYLPLISLFFTSLALGHTCDQEISIQCPLGYIDGCLVDDESTQNKRLTTHHVCIWESSIEDEKEYGIPCEQEIARLCRVAHEDACFMKPQVAETHLCILNQ